MKATITIDPYRTIGTINPNIYGQFLCRRKEVADGGLYNPEHPDADENGLRKKVVDYIAQSAPPIIRWPGGCTAMTFDWRESVGPIEQRSRTFDTHFRCDVTNGFGTVEFIEFCRRIGAEPHLNFNTGTGTLRDALEWVEYCNYDGDSKYANLRRAHGYEEPFNVRYWQLGNEEYNKGEIGHKTPEEYAVFAREWAKTLKKYDPDLKLLAVGGMAHFCVEWDLAVLEKAWRHIDYITAHRYWNFNSAKGEENYDSIAAVGYIEEQNMKALIGLIDYMAAKKETLNRPQIAYTEWNVRDTSQAKMIKDKGSLGRTKYRVVDALAVAGFINAMQRQCQRVTLSSFAQSINVVGMLYVNNEHVVRETLYWALKMQRHLSAPIAINSYVDCDGYSTTLKHQPMENVPFIDVSATLDEDNKRLVLSLINRHRAEEITTRVNLKDTKPKANAKLHRLWHEDPLAMNTIDNPDTVVPEESTITNAGTDFEIALLPHSYSVIELHLG